MEIRDYNDPILKKRAEEVKIIYSEIKGLVFDMEKTMIENNGIGLAAPQVGILKRIIVVQSDNFKPIALINPKIIKKSSEKEKGEEGCLSFPGIFLEIKRAKNIEVEALNIDNEKITIKAQGLLARVVQHEIDHLDGILFFDRLSFFKKIGFKLKHGFN